MSNLLCEMCLIDKPPSSFPNLKAMQVCGPCMMGQRVAKTELAMAAKAKEIAGQFADISTHDITAETGRVRQIIADVYANFGGPSGFANHIYKVIMELSNRRPMPSSVGNLLLVLLKLHHTVEQTEETITARNLTDDQLRREQEVEMMKLAFEAINDPSKRDLLTNVLAKQGFAITKSNPDNVMADIATKLLGPDE